MQAAFVSPAIHDGFCGFADELRAAFDSHAGADAGRSPALSPEAAFGAKLAARYREHFETWSLLRYGLMPLRTMVVRRDKADAELSNVAALKFFHWLPAPPAIGAASRDRLVLAIPAATGPACNRNAGDGAAIAGELVAVEPVLLGALPGESLGSERARLMRDLTLLAVEAGMELDGVQTMRADIGRDGAVSRAAVLCDLVQTSSAAAEAGKLSAMERVLARLRQTRLPAAHGPSVLIASLRFGAARAM